MSRRVDGAACILTAEDAAILWQAAKLDDVRIRFRDDKRIHTVLADIWVTALSLHTNADSGNNNPVKTAIREHVSKEVVTVTDIAKHSGIPARTIRSHIKRELLPATQVGREWTITSRDAKAYIAGQKRN